MKLYSYTKYRSLHFDKTMYSKLKLELQQEINKMVSCYIIGYSLCADIIYV